MLTNWERATTLYALVRLDAKPPLKSPAPHEIADANPKNMVDKPELITYVQYQAQHHCCAPRLKAIILIHKMPSTRYRSSDCQLDHT
jgi:hypothetical protein